MKKKILLVDDEEWTKDVLEIGLNPLQYELLYCRSVDSAIKRLKKTSDIQLIVLDLVMPGKACFDLLDYLEASKMKVQVVVVSAMDHADTATRAFKKGAID
ncbi:MAG: response regulator [Thermodesulfovibrionales bacterium]|jgi:DNA-binding NtrC family response regulator